MYFTCMQDQVNSLQSDLQRAQMQMQRIQAQIQAKDKELDHHKAMNQIVTAYHEINRVQFENHLREAQNKVHAYEDEIQRAKNMLREQRERIVELEPSTSHSMQQHKLHNLSEKEMDIIRRKHLEEHKKRIDEELKYHDEQVPCEATVCLKSYGVICDYRMMFSRTLTPRTYNRMVEMPTR